MGGGGLVGASAAPFTYAAHVLGVASAVMVLVWCVNFRGGLAFESTNKNLIFNLHPVLMLIGFIILGGEAIMSYKALPLSKEVKKLIHLILHAIATVLGAVGIYAAFKFHNESGIANLYSLHSWVGLGTICLYGIQCFVQATGVCWIDRGETSLGLAEAWKFFGGSRRTFAWALGVQHEDVLAAIEDMMWWNEAIKCEQRESMSVVSLRAL